MTQEEYVTEWLPHPSFSLELLSIDTSRSAIHETYQVLINDIPLLHAAIKFSTYTTQSTVVSSPDLTAINVALVPNVDRTSYSQLIKSLNSSDNIYNSDIQYYISNNSVEFGLVIEGNDYGYDYRHILNESGELIMEYILSSNNRDTTVLAQIFNPDPITSAETEYGGNYSDQGDMSNDQLLAAMSQGNVSLRWNEDSLSWELKSDFAWALDLDQSPKIAPPFYTNLTPTSLFYTRSESEFEFINVYYHLNTYHQHLTSLGSPLMNYPQKFDAHAKNGADQSSFNPGNNDPNLLFGDGGVDDGEDADVIVHEYGHAILYDAAPNSNIGAQRNALDEGTSDYIAMSYSKSINEYGYQDIFNWDGHNEYWNGRELVSNRTYPSDLVDNEYADGLLWASAIMEISNCIGRRQTDSILFEAIYSFFPFMTMSQATDAFMSAETNATLGDYKEICEVVFCTYGLLEQCHDTLLSELPLRAPYLGNTYDFGFNNDPIYLFTNGNEIEYIEIFNLQGRLVYFEEWNKSEALFYKLSFESLTNGGYILRITTDSEVYPFKLLKFR
ncbi:MAG: T9SS type A sorting domain-containing protein [Flavobacteriales bacterium]|nr:T9SS type A sorting domain-containing protein [Flavobacteriales bacterium]